MSKNKYPSIFSPQMEAIMFIILQIFLATHAALKIKKYLSNRPQHTSFYGLYGDKPRGMLVEHGNNSF